MDHPSGSNAARGSGSRRHPLGAVALAVVLLAGGVSCSSDGNAAAGEGEDASIAAATTEADFDVQPGIGFVAVQGAEPGTTLVLGSEADDEVERGSVDRYGSLAFIDVEPGVTYTVRGEDGDEIAGSDEVTTLALDEHPPESFYEELPEIPEGYGYLETRDGTELAITVRAPAGASLDDGPFPTLINMSGYPDANPDSTPPMALIASTLGYATVSVNVRGSGCSGGIGGLFEQTWAADGYDVVEAVAAQPWSTKVGLTGISFPGITQLGTAATQPPHLAAAAPMSVLADIYRTPGYPGGIFNNGFTKSWLTDRRNDSLPAPESGQGYAIKRIEDGDEECRANQRLRLQTRDPIELANANPYRDPELIDERSPITVVNQIEAPLLVSGAWQDEQVGSDFANLFSELPDRPNVKVVAANGVHSTPIEPELLTQWLAFMDIYVAERVPDFSTLESIQSVVAQESQGGDTEVPPFPDNPYRDDETLAEAKARYEAQPRFRVIFDNGGDPERPGVPGGGFERGFDTWPPTEAEATRWYFGADGTLTESEPTEADASDQYFPDIDARPMQTIPGQGQSESWVLLPEYDWRPLVADTAVAYLTPELTEDTTMVGSGSVDLWVKSSTPEADLQVALTEVRSDGTEVYVQNGWLRGSHRQLDEELSTDLNPWPTHLEADAEPFPTGEFVLARVAIAPVAHVFREGSRIRISVAAPGGDRTRWSFESAPPPPEAQVWIGRSSEYPSSVLLPLTTDVEATTPAPACPGLRGQPCRTYESASNGG